MSSQSIGLSSELAQYVQDHSVKMPELLKQLREETIATFEAAPMLISPEQGQLFTLLLKLIKAKRVLEIGTFTGYSSSVMAMALPADGSVTCCDTSYDWTRLAIKYWQLLQIEHKISLRIAPAMETLDQLLHEPDFVPFDFIFIDADKRNHINYYERSLQLVRPGGLIAIDNVLWKGKVIDEDDQQDNTNDIRKLNEHVFNDDRVEMCMLPVGDGLTLVMKPD